MTTLLCHGGMYQPLLAESGYGYHKHVNLHLRYHLPKQLLGLLHD